MSSASVVMVEVDTAAAAAAAEATVTRPRLLSHPFFPYTFTTLLAFRSTLLICNVHLVKSLGDGGGIAETLSWGTLFGPFR
jgi:hypothetical protein